MQGLCYIDLVRDNRKGGVLSRYCSWRKNQSSDLPSLFFFRSSTFPSSPPPISYLPFISVLSLFIRLLLFHSVINTFTCSRLLLFPAFYSLFFLLVQKLSLSLLPPLPLFFVYDRIFLVIEAFRFSLCIPFHYWRLYSSSFSSSRNLDSPRFVVFSFPPFYCLLDTPRCVSYIRLSGSFFAAFTDTPPPAVSFLSLILISFLPFLFRRYIHISHSFFLQPLISSHTSFKFLYLRILFSRKIKNVSNKFLYLILRSCFQTSEL